MRDRRAALARIAELEAALSRARSPDPPTDEEVERIAAVAFGTMSLRDWFAGRALSCGPISGAASDETIRAAAEWSYRVADAMLAARAKSR